MHGISSVSGLKQHQTASHRNGALSEKSCKKGSSRSISTLRQPKPDDFGSSLQKLGHLKNHSCRISRHRKTFEPKLMKTYKTLHRKTWEGIFANISMNCGNAISMPAKGASKHPAKGIIKVYYSLRFR